MSSSEINIIPTEYKLDAKPFNMLNPVEDQLAEYRSDDAVVTNNQVVRIQVKDISTFTNLNRAYLEVKWKLVKLADGTNYAAAEKVALAGHVACMFSRAVLRIQNSIIETVDEQHLCAQLKSLLHFSDDYSRSTATNQFYFKDTGSLLDASADALRVYNNGVNIAGPNLLDIQENPLYNKGAAIRIQRNLNSAVATAFIPLSFIFGFCQVDRLMTGNTISVELTRSSAVEHIIRNAAAGDAKVEFQKISLWASRVLPSPALELSLKSAMGGGLKSVYKYPIVNAYTSDTLAGTGSTNFRVLTQSEEIKNVFVYVRQVPGTQLISKNKTLNEFDELEIRINGVTYNSRRYDNLRAVAGVEVTEGRTRAYTDLLHYLNKNRDPSTGIQLDRLDFENRSIYHFDVAAHPQNWAKSSTTLEVVCNTSGLSGVDRQIVCVVVSERVATLNYGGSQPTITIT